MLSERSHIGRYQLQNKLGEGASGIVYRAYDPVMDRSVGRHKISQRRNIDR
jgi:serine/threonine protein kinase